MALIINGKRKTGFPLGLIVFIVTALGIVAAAWFTGIIKPAKLKASEIAERALVDSLNDAKAYERISITPRQSTVLGSDGVWEVEIQFRAKNAFGALIRAARVIRVDLDTNGIADVTPAS